MVLQSATAHLLVLAFVLLAATPQAALLPTHGIMPWFCTQRCGFNTSQIEAHVKQAAALAEGGVDMHVVAFERYNLGPNSSLVFNADLFDVNGYLRRNATLSNLIPTRIAMVSSFPYPPEFLDWMRQLFANPGPFIAALLSELHEHDIDGVNIDFEPTSDNATSEDALRYAQFLGLLKARLGAEGKAVTVAGATWSPIWNLSAIARALAPASSNSSVDVGYFTSMNTYTFHNSIFLDELRTNLYYFRTFGTTDSLVVGVETWPANFTLNELQHHFVVLGVYGICRLAVWDMPIPEMMVPFLLNMSTRCRGN